MLNRYQAMWDLECYLIFLLKEINTNNTITWDVIQFQYSQKQRMLKSERNQF